MSMHELAMHLFLCFVLCVTCAQGAPFMCLGHDLCAVMLWFCSWWVVTFVCIVIDTQCSALRLRSRLAACTDLSDSDIYQISQGQVSSCSQMKAHCSDSNAKGLCCKTCSSNSALSPPPFDEGLVSYVSPAFVSPAFGDPSALVWTACHDSSPTAVLVRYVHVHPAVEPRVYPMI